MSKYQKHDEIEKEHEVKIFVFFCRVIYNYFQCGVMGHISGSDDI